jgi:hypothetical protein
VLDEAVAVVLAVDDAVDLGANFLLGHRLYHQR